LSLFYECVALRNILLYRESADIEVCLIRHVFVKQLGDGLEHTGMAPLDFLTIVLSSFILGFLVLFLRLLDGAVMYD